MDFIFEKGVGQGRFTDKDYIFKGHIVNLEFEDDSFHGPCTFKYNDGEVHKCFYDNGAIKEKAFINRKENWKFKMKGEFEED